MTRGLAAPPAGLFQGTVTVLALSVLVASGCAIGPQPLPGEQGKRPEWRVGDRWMFARTGSGGNVTVAVHEVTAATSDGYRVRISGLGPDIVRSWTRDLHLSRQGVEGQWENRFVPAARYFEWPLALASQWRQEFEYRDGRNDGRYINHWRVAEETEVVRVLGGVFQAVRIEHLGGQREPLETYWYVPAVRYWVKLEHHADRYVDELLQFTPA